MTAFTARRDRRRPSYVPRMPAVAPVVHVVVTQHESWLTIPGEAAALVAAGFALVTIFYARSTVQEAKKTSEQLDEIGKAAQSGVTEQRATVETLGTAHREEMAERARALDAELLVPRLAQLERASEVLLELVDVTQAECVAPPYQLEPGKTLTRVPALLIRLQGAVEILARLGGSELVTVKQLGRSADSGRDLLPQVRGVAIDALSEIKTLARKDPRLRLPSEPSTPAR